MSFPENFSSVGSGSVIIVERTPLQMEVDSKLNELTTVVTQKALFILKSFDYSTKNNVVNAAARLKKFLIETDSKLANTTERINTFINKMLPQFETGIKSVMTKENFNHNPADPISNAVMSDFAAAMEKLTNRPDFLPTFAKGMALPLAIATIDQLDAIRGDIVDQLEYPDTTLLPGTTLS